MNNIHIWRKNMDNSKLVSDLSGILEGLDSSQEQLEKDAFDVINHQIHDLIS